MMGYYTLIIFEFGLGQKIFMTQTEMHRVRKKKCYNPGYKK